MGEFSKVMTGSRLGKDRPIVWNIPCWLYGGVFVANSTVTVTATAADK